MAKYLTNLGSDGTVIGQTVSEKIGFYGATPTAQITVSSGVATSSATTITSLLALISALGSVGIIKAT